MPAKTARSRSGAMLRVVAPRKAASEPAARAALVAEPRTMSLPFIGADVGVSDRLLAATLAASIVLHAVVLALKFSPFDLSVFDRSGPPLEVALVNAKSKTKPTKPEILAQHHLEGGGRRAHRAQSDRRTGAAALAQRLRNHAEDARGGALGSPDLQGDGRVRQAAQAPLRRRPRRRIPLRALRRGLAAQGRARRQPQLPGKCAYAEALRQPAADGRHS